MAPIEVDQVEDALPGHGIERDTTTPGPFAHQLEPLTGETIPCKHVLNVKRTKLLSPKPGVQGKQDQGDVSGPERLVGSNGVEQLVLLRNSANPKSKACIDDLSKGVRARA